MNTTKKRFCKYGHDISIVGRECSGGCSLCARRLMVKLRQANPIKAKQQSTFYTWRKRLKKYGITVDEYNKRFLEQAGRCAICMLPQAQLSRALSVDHNHTTGVIRGLLCVNCNSALGMVKDNLTIIEAMRIYLNKNS